MAGQWQRRRKSELHIWGGIFGYKLRTSVLDGISNKLKVLKLVAYGYRDTDYFFLIIQPAFKGRPAIN